MVAEKTEPIALVVDKLKGLAKSTQDFTNGILHSVGFSRRRHPIEILKRLQREAFTDIMKLRDRQDKVERILSFKSTKASPFDENATRVRGEIEALGMLLMIDRINENNQDAILRTGIKTGVNSRFTFETTIREKDTLVAEFVGSGNGKLDNLATPLSLSKVIYGADVNDWCSLIAAPLGARCSDVGPSRSSRQEHSLTSRPFSQPPLLNQHIGSGISLTVKKPNVIASLAQFISISEIKLNPVGPTHYLTTFGQLIYQLPLNTKLLLLGLHQIPKFESQISSIGPITIPIGIFRNRKSPMEVFNHNSSFGSTGLVLETDLDSSTRIGGWVQMNNKDIRNVEWGLSISDLPEDDFGWGLRVNGSFEGSKNREHCEIEAFSKVKFGEKFSLQPSVIYVMNNSSHFPAVTLKSSWSF